MAFQLLTNLGPLSLALGKGLLKRKMLGKKVESYFEGVEVDSPEGNGAKDGNDAAESDNNPLPISLVRLRREKLLVKEHF